MKDCFIISDTHFFHKKIQVFEPCRLALGATVDEMSYEIARRWNEVVGPNDKVIHLGDVVFQLFEKKEEVKKLIQSLNGYKILHKGNHDHKNSDFYLDLGFSEVSSGRYMGYDSFILSHEPILDTKVLNIHGHLHSYPNPNDPGHRPDESPEPDSPLHFNASIEMLPDFKPVRLSWILDKMGVKYDFGN